MKSKANTGLARGSEASIRDEEKWMMTRTMADKIRTKVTTLSRALVVAVASALTIGAVGCQPGVGEGERCNPFLSHDECGDGLMCTNPSYAPTGATCGESYCCPINGMSGNDYCNGINEMTCPIPPSSSSSSAAGSDDGGGSDGGDASVDGADAGSGSVPDASDAVAEGGSSDSAALDAAVGDGNSGE
jgi:hypothetical protein